MKNYLAYVLVPTIAVFVILFGIVFAARSAVKMDKKEAARRFDYEIMCGQKIYAFGNIKAPVYIQGMIRVEMSYGDIYLFPQASCIAKFKEVESAE